MDRGFYQIFDAYQLPGYGGMVQEGYHYSFRYYLSKKLFFKSLYIPYGPVCETFEGFQNFVNDLKQYRFTKIHIDLPIIYNPELEKLCVNLLRDEGFTQSEYILDNETLLVTPDNYTLNKRNMRYVRQGLREFIVEVVEHFNEDELREIEQLLAHASKTIGYKQKPFSSVLDVLGNGLSSVAYNRINGKIEGILIGYTNELNIGPERPTKILQLMFTALSDEARHVKAGFALHSALFDIAFHKSKYDIIDFHGASRSQGRSYVEFKRMFGGEFKSNAGSFKKFQW